MPTVAPDTKRRRRPRPLESTTVWLTVKEAAGHIGVSIDIIYDACANRGLKHVKLGHSTIRIRKDWLEEWMEEQAR